MTEKHALGGVYAAAITPITRELQPETDAVTQRIQKLADAGCHGALILGTTGEGPSFNQAQRVQVMSAAAKIKSTHPDFHLFAGTGTPSLRDTIELNQAAFSLGFDAVVVLPPFYFRGASEDGLAAWYAQVIKESVPQGKLLLGYHIPQVSGVPLKIELLKRLREAFPNRFGGLKDSQGSLEQTQAYAGEFGDRLVLVGNDRLLSPGLEGGASGCITALANLISPWLRQVSDNFGSQTAVEYQTKVDQARAILDDYAPFPASIKALLCDLQGEPDWPVMPPLAPLEKDARKTLVSRFKSLLESS